MPNDFPLNVEQSKEYRSLLKSFYQYIASGEDPEYLDGKTYFEQMAQHKIHIDLLLPSDQGKAGHEEKIIQWPAANEPHTHYYMETESCTRPGLYTAGWGRTCEADYLNNVFVLPYGLDIHHITFQPYKKWFWRVMRDDPTHFKPHRNPEKNQSQGVKVNIVEAYKHTPIKRYFLEFNGTCQQIEINTNLVALKLSAKEPV